MTSSNGNTFCVTGPLCGEFPITGEFPSQRPVTRSFDVFFDLRLNKRLSKQSWGFWFETPLRSLWRQCNGIYESIRRSHGLTLLGLGPPNLDGKSLPFISRLDTTTDVKMNAMASQITGVSIVCSTVCSGADQRKHQSIASLAFVRGIHRWSVDSPHKGL